MKVNFGQPESSCTDNKFDADCAASRLQARRHTHPGCAPQKSLREIIQSGGLPPCPPPMMASQPEARGVGPMKVNASHLTAYTQALDPIEPMTITELLSFQEADHCHTSSPGSGPQLESCNEWSLFSAEASPWPSLLLPPGLLLPHDGDCSPFSSVADDESPKQCLSPADPIAKAGLNIAARSFSPPWVTELKDNLQWTVRALGEPEDSVVFVGNIKEATESQVRKLFEPFGEVVKVHIPRSSENSKSRGFCSVKFAEPQSSVSLLALYNTDSAPCSGAPEGKEGWAPSLRHLERRCSH